MDREKEKKIDLDPTGNSENEQDVLESVRKVEKISDFDVLETWAKE